jgi:hypothetical protein
MYACILELGADFSRGAQVEDRPFTFRDPAPPCYSRMVLCQPGVSGDSRSSESLFTAPISCA